MTYKRGGSEDKRILKGAHLTKRRKQMYIDNPHCNVCGRLTQYPKGFQIDHIKPLSKGGTDTPDNVQLLCLDCHDTKTAKDLNHVTRPIIGLDGWPEGEG